MAKDVKPNNQVTKMRHPGVEVEIGQNYASLPLSRRLQEKEKMLTKWRRKQNSGATHHSLTRG